MESIFMIICIVLIIFVIIKIMIPINKASNYVTAKIEEATENAKLDAQERLTKRVRYLQRKYGKNGLIAYEDLDKIASMDFKTPNNIHDNES